MMINEEIKKNPDLIRYKYIRMLEGQEIQTMIVPSSEGIILDVSSKKAQD